MILIGVRYYARTHFDSLSFTLIHSIHHLNTVQVYFTYDHDYTNKYLPTYSCSLIHIHTCFNKSRHKRITTPPRYPVFSADEPLNIPAFDTYCSFGWHNRGVDTVPYMGVERYTSSFSARQMHFCSVCLWYVCFKEQRRYREIWAY